MGGHEVRSYYEVVAVKRFEVQSGVAEYLF